MNLFILLGLAFLVLVALRVLAQNRGASELEKVYGNPSKLVELMEKKNEPFILVDVRTPEEYASGHIPGALNIPVDRIAQTPPIKDKDALIILYCRSGNRSGIAKRALEQMGYTRLVNFGAVSRWPKKLVTGDKPE